MVKFPSPVCVAVLLIWIHVLLVKGVHEQHGLAVTVATRAPPNEVTFQVCPTCPVTDKVYEQMSRIR